MFHSVLKGQTSNIIRIINFKIFLSYIIIKFVFKAIVVEAEEWNPEVKAPLRMDNASQVISVFTYLYLHQSDFVLKDLD